MNDIVDKTQQREEIMWDNWRKQRQAGQEQQNSTNISERCCIDCGEIIPLARIKAQPQCVRCIDCQQELEKTRK